MSGETAAQLRDARRKAARAAGEEPRGRGITRPTGAQSAPAGRPARPPIRSVSSAMLRVENRKLLEIVSGMQEDRCIVLHPPRAD